LSRVLFKGVVDKIGVVVNRVKILSRGGLFVE